MIIDGRALSHQYTELLREHITGTPGLAAILVGDNPASRIYIEQKKKRAENIGIYFTCKELSKDATADELLSVIRDLNHDNNIHGIILQLPLPPHLKSGGFLEAISPQKDVDGLHPYNLGSLFQENIHFAPCTPQGCVQLMKTVYPDLSGKKVLILGRSNLVGKPLLHLLLRANATVQIAHSKSLDVKKLCHHADIIVSAMGAPHFVDDTFVKDNHLVIDVGITKVGDKIYGDVDFDKVEPIVKYITSVPGGVGPMTVFNLMLNTVIAYMRAHHQELPHVLKCML